jgi:hypothetical protein
VRRGRYHREMYPYTPPTGDVPPHGEVYEAPHPAARP